MDILNFFTNCYIADFETVVAETNYYKKHNKTKIVYGVIKNMRGYNEKSFINLADFFKIIESFKQNEVIIYFHNLGFDASFILWYLDSLKFSAEKDNLQPNTFSVFRTTSQKIYHLRVNWKGILIEFKCSKLILSSSVKSLGKNINLDKYSGIKDLETFYIVEPENSLKEFETKNHNYCLYCKRDVEIVRISLISFYKEIYTVLANKNKADKFDQVLKCFTISGISFLLQDIFLNLKPYQNNPLFLHNWKDREIGELFKQGGLTLINYKYKQQIINQDIYSIDLKSAYPAVMGLDKVAYKYCGLFNNYKNYEELIQKYKNFQKDYYFFVEFSLINVTPKNHKIPILKNFSKNRIVPHFLSCEIYHGYYLLEELIVLLKFYNYSKIVVRKVHKLKKKCLFYDFVNQLYFYKDKHKQDKKLAQSHTHKILLNSGYGVHCKRWDYLTVLSYEPDSLIFSLEKKKDKQFTYLYKKNINLNQFGNPCYLPNNQFFVGQPINICEFEGFLNNVWIANTITAKTRIKIMEKILEIGFDNFLYSDTDSVFMINKNLEEVKKMCGKNLGDWELENNEPYESGFFARKKLYELKKGEKVVKKGSAGFSKINDLANLDTNIEHSAGLISEFVVGGIILVESFKKITFENQNLKIVENTKPLKITEEINKKIERAKKLYGN